ncbi:MAG: dethiobiotin synthase [Pirellulales bacterium]|nr:dethiobiotin synthase [Pirellulales bacterium]
MSDRTRGLFITGTNTEIGKTYVTALIARNLVRTGHRVGVYKPTASGCRNVDGQLIADDAIAIWEAAGRPGSLEEVCPQCFRAPLAPHLAAAAEGKKLDEDLLVSGIETWHARSDVILVEGAGGLMSPLGHELYVATLAQQFGFPLIVVVPNALGMINQTLQTVMAAECFGDFKSGDNLSVAGVVINTPLPVSDNDSESADISRGSNRQELSRHCGPPILAEVGWQSENFDADVDWFALAR